MIGPPPRALLAQSGVGLLATLGAFEVLVALFVRPATAGTPLGGILVPWPLLSSLAPLALVAAWPGPMATQERLAARPPWQPTALRLAPLLAIVAAATAGVALLAPSDAQPIAGDGVIAWRNAALVAGLALLAAGLLPAGVRWVPPVGYVLVCAAAGVPEGGEPYPWSVITHDRGDLGVGLGVLADALIVIAWRTGAGRRAAAPPGGPAPPGRRRPRPPRTRP